MPTFGKTIVTLPAAGEANPHRTGIYVETIHRAGRLNPGKHYRVTNGRGDFWMVRHDYCELSEPAAYEIDGVRELLAAVDVVLNANGFNPANENELEYGLFCAAARVREAMGGGK